MTEMADKEVQGGGCSLSRRGRQAADTRGSWPCGADSQEAESKWEVEMSNEANPKAQPLRSSSSSDAVLLKSSTTFQHGTNSRGSCEPMGVISPSNLNEYILGKVIHETSQTNVTTSPGM